MTASTKVPHDVEKMFDEIKDLTVADTVEDSDAGLRFQYENGFIDDEGVEKVLTYYRRMKFLIERGLFTP